LDIAMQTKRPQDFRTAFIDVLMNVNTAIIAISVLSFMLIQPLVKKNEGIEKKAEFVATIEWDKTLDCDVDFWVQDPNGVVVSFQRKDFGLMNIERDDLGFHGDGIVTRNGTKIVSEDNSETWVLRGVTPGEYTFNAHVYSCRISPESDVRITAGNPTPKPIVVNFRLIRINPSYTEVVTRTRTFSKVWEEQTFVNLTLDTERRVSNQHDDFKPLVEVNRR
jgi:hypothetical protein